MRELGKRGETRGEAHEKIERVSDVSREVDELKSRTVGSVPWQGDTEKTLRQAALLAKGTLRAAKDDDFFSGYEVLQVGLASAPQTYTLQWDQAGPLPAAALPTLTEQSKFPLGNLVRAMIAIPRVGRMVEDEGVLVRNKEGKPLAIVCRDESTEHYGIVLATDQENIGVGFYTDTTREGVGGYRTPSQRRIEEALKPFTRKGQNAMRGE